MKHILFFLFLSFCFGNSFSQTKTSTEKKPILIAIEDSLRDRIKTKYDSAWMNLNLEFQQSVLNIPNIYYKLVKIGKRDFTEGHHAKLIEEIDSLYISQKKYNSSFGDSNYSLTGEKIYTYIGNSSWGYYVLYHFERVYSKIDGFENKFNPIPTCKHGWEIARGQPCEGCRLGDNSQFKTTSTKAVLDSTTLIKLIEHRKPNTCEHGWDMNRGLACSQCLHNYRKQYDSSYRAKDSIKKLKEVIQIMDCNHGHICCDVSWCDCCPEKHPKISIEPIYKPLILINPVCKHGHDQNAGQACPQCLHEYRMSKDSTLKPYLEYFPKVTDSIKRTIPLDCNHGHLCCQVKCPCCPEGGPPEIYVRPQPTHKKKWWQRKKK